MLKYILIFFIAFCSCTDNQHNPKVAEYYFPKNKIKRNYSRINTSLFRVIDYTIPVKLNSQLLNSPPTSYERKYISFAFDDTTEYSLKIEIDSNYIMLEGINKQQIPYYLFIDKTELRAALIAWEPINIKEINNNKNNLTIITYLNSSTNKIFSTIKESTIMQLCPFVQGTIKSIQVDSIEVGINQSYNFHSSFDKFLHDVNIYSKFNFSIQYRNFVINYL